MPHVFTLEGPDLSALPTVTYPPAGSPLAPSIAIVGPTRVATMVFGPGGTPQMYKRRYPARGPVCNYCDPNYYTVADGGQQVIPYKKQQFGDSGDFFARQNPLVAGLMILGGALAAGAALAAGGVWLYRRTSPAKHAMDMDW
jgi:hypothetical protein